jgi:hypothetical protein
MNRNGMIAGVAFVAAALFAVGALNADEPKKDDKAAKRATKEQLKDMMTKLHKGEKAPLARTAAEVKKDAPDWDQLAKDAKGFTEMGAVLKGSVGYTDPTRYISGAAALTKAVGEKDKKASAVAFTAFRQSCSACHYGNPAK